MKDFLERLSIQLSRTYDNPKDLCVVLPSKRAGTFFKKHLAKAYGKNIQAPAIISLNELIEKLTSLKQIDNLESIFLLYNKYLEILTSENEAPEDLENFIGWAPAMLADFNEIDKYLVNTLPFFTYINDIRAIETWNINGEPLTEHQIQYIRFWKRSGKLYHAFKKQLLEEKQVYSGLNSRYAAENIHELANKLPYEKVIFAGFNALSASEQVIFSYYIKNKKGEVYWETQDYFIKDNKQEAGYFLREIQKSWANYNINWKDSFLQADQSTELSLNQINIINCNTNFAQTQVAAEILSEIGNDTKEMNTAVVLNKEDLLFPLLNSLPENIKAANVTMGYELKLSPLAGFIACLFDLWNNYQAKKDKSAFYYKNVLQLIEHPYFEILNPKKKEILQLKSDISSKNKIYISLNFILNYFKNKELITALFNTESQDLAYNTQKILQIFASLKNAFNEQNLPNFDKSLQIEFLFHYTLVFRRLSQIINKNPLLNSCSLKLYKHLVNQLVNKEKMDFYGEPLQGIQIMGMLETRALNFENIIMLSVNEGILPGGKSNNSFIPFDVKKEFGLPTHSEQDAIFAYHFYRLALSSKKIDLIYFTGNDDFGGNSEKSRFIEQIIHEFPSTFGKAVKITTRNYNPTPLIDKKNTQIIKNKELIQLIRLKLKSGISPSALNTLIQCPLDFYYRYLLKLGEQEDIEENIKASTLGTCIHNTLERLYKEHLGQNLNSALINTFIIKSEAILIEEFEHFLSLNDLKSGSNLLTLEVAKRYLKKFLSFESSIINQKNYAVTQVELNLESEINLLIQNQNFPIKIHGKVDRISQIDNEIQLLDYKTGSVENKHLNFKDLDELCEKSDKSKALQLLTYSWLYYQNNPNSNTINPCIYSFKNGKAGFMPLKHNNTSLSKNDVLEIFPKVLEKILGNLLDENSSFSHSKSSKYCEYCN